jgi:hypothetical protein
MASGYDIVQKGISRLSISPGCSEMLLCFADHTLLCDHSGCISRDGSQLEVLVCLSHLSYTLSTPACDRLQVLFAQVLFRLDMLFHRLLLLENIINDTLIWCWG